MGTIVFFTFGAARWYRLTSIVVLLGLLTDRAQVMSGTFELLIEISFVKARVRADLKVFAQRYNACMRV